MGQITFPSHIDGTGDSYLGRKGTGSVETIKHGLGHIPGFVLLQLRDTAGAANTYTIGASTSTQTQVTVSNNAIYDLIIFGARGI